METLLVTRYQARMPDSTPTRRMLAKAAYGDTDFGEVEHPSASDAARLIAACVRVHGAEPISRSLRMGLPRRKIHRTGDDVLVANVLAARSECGTVSVFVTVDRLAASINVVQDRFVHRGQGERASMVHTSNAASVMPSEKDGSVLADRWHRYIDPYDRMMFSVATLDRTFDIADARSETPVIADAGYESNAQVWDDEVFTSALAREGADLDYDVMWRRMQVASAWLTARDW